MYHSQTGRCVENRAKFFEKWMQPIIIKVLITTRWKLNQLIDKNIDKSADVQSERWKILYAPPMLRRLNPNR